MWKRFFYKNSLHCLNIVTHSEWPWAWLLSEWERNSALRGVFGQVIPKQDLDQWWRKEGVELKRGRGIGGLTMMASIKSLCLLLCLAIVQRKNNHEWSSSPTSSTVISKWKSSREIIYTWCLIISEIAYDERLLRYLLELVTFQLGISRS